MPAFDAQLTEQLRSACRRFRVARLYLVGSAATGNFNADSSDLDFLVEFQPHERSGFDDVCFQLRAELERMTGRHVDLIEREFVANEFVRRSLESNKVELYAAA